MKQMKFFLVALMTVFTGMTVTSCLKSDDNTIHSGTVFAKCVNSYPPTFQLGNDQKLVITNLPALSTLNTGDIYVFSYKFDTAEQAADSPSINVTLIGDSPVNINAKATEGPTHASESTAANAPIYMFNGNLDNFHIKPDILYKDEYLWIPATYWIKFESDPEKQKKEIEKHSFILTFVQESIKPGDTELLMTLNHRINESSSEPVERNRYTVAYKAYRLGQALAVFQNKTGKKPAKIKVKAQTNQMKNTLEGSTEQEWEYTFK